MDCKLTIKDEVNISFTGLPPEVRRKIANALKFQIPYARHMPAFKMGRWDGTTSFFGIGGNGFLNHLDVIIPIIEESGYTISEIIDNRQPYDITFDKIDENYWSDQGKVWPAGHRFAGEPVVLRDYQVDAVNGFLANPQCINVLATSAGKCQPLSSKVLTPTGWTTMGDIVEGDYVLTSTGKSVKVLQTYYPGQKDVYEITFADGRKARCCGDHLWKVYHTDWTILSTSELIEHDLNYAIPLVSMENDNQDIELPLDPWLLGSLLSGYAIGTFETSLLKEHNISDSIPEIYFNASLEQRINLVKGFIDSMGTFHENTFLYLKSPTLIKDFRRLVFSTGKIATITEGDVGYTIEIKADDKLSITSIEKVSHEEVKCILIDDADHLYVTDDYIVTHNTLITTALSAVCEKYGRTMVVVPSKNLVVQTEEDYLNLGMDVGVYYGDRKDLDKTHTIVTWQSLAALDKKDDEALSLTKLIDGVICVIIDECHTVKGNVLKEMLSSSFSNTPIRWGLTGTIPKDDISYHSLITSIGPVVNQIKAKELQDKGYISTCHVNILQLVEYKEFRDYKSEYKYLSSDLARVVYIAGLCRNIAVTGNTIILVDRIECGEILNKNIEGSVFISGKDNASKRKDQYKDINLSDNKVLIATYGILSTGVSIDRIFNVVLFEPGKSFIKVIQSIGRGLRKSSDKDHVNIYDITATCKYSKRHLTERKKFYKEAEYPTTIEKINWIQ